MKTITFYSPQERAQVVIKNPTLTKFNRRLAIRFDLRTAKDDKPIGIFHEYVDEGEEGLEIVDLDDSVLKIHRVNSNLLRATIQQVLDHGIFYNERVKQ